MLTIKQFCSLYSQRFARLVPHLVKTTDFSGQFVTVTGQIKNKIADYISQTAHVTGSSQSQQQIPPPPSSNSLVDVSKRPSATHTHPLHDNASF